MNQTHRNDTKEANAVRLFAQLFDRATPAAPPLDRATTKVVSGAIVAVVLALFGLEAQANVVMRGAVLSSAPDFGQGVADWLVQLA